MTASRHRDELLRTHLDRFTRLLRKVDRGDVRAIHRARVASRRLRELMPILEIDAELCEKILRGLRRATKALGRVRELDVLSGLVAEMRSGSPDGLGLARVLDRISLARTVTFERATKKGLGRKLRQVARRLERVAAALAPEKGRDGRRWRWALEARVARRAGALRSSIEAAGAAYLPERLHQVRIAVKKLRYALELGADASGSKPRTELGGLRRGQQLLGTLHDRTVLIDTIRDVQAALPADEIHLTRELDLVISTLEDDCRRLHARYVRARAGLLEVCDLLSVRPAPGARSGRGPLRAASAG